MSVDTITAIKKSLEGVTPDRAERLWWFLHILSKSSGTTNAEDDNWNWINAFCTDYEDDTFNLAHHFGFIRVSHDSFMGTSTASMTYEGNVFIDYFDRPPSATVNAALESLQRENEELRKKADARENELVGMLNSADESRVCQIRRAEAAEAEVERLRQALEGIANPKVVQRFGDPVVLRDAARAALASTGGEHHAE